MTLTVAGRWRVLIRQGKVVLLGYWCGAVLGIAAIVLLAFGSPAKAALAGAGFAFVGAVLIRITR